LKNLPSPLVWKKGEFLPLEKGGKEGFSYNYVNPIMRTLIKSIGYRDCGNVQNP
jgi:hypothetical protein